MNYIGVIDFETDHKKEINVCIECKDLHNVATPSIKDEIKQKCINRNHLISKKHKCMQCDKDFKMLLNNEYCRHYEYSDRSIFKTCEDCFHSIDAKFECKHSKTEEISSLNPLSYSIAIYDNYFDKIVWFSNYQKKYQTDENPVIHLYNLLYYKIIPKLEKKMKPKKPMILTDEDKRKISLAKKCYTCKKSIYGIQKVRDRKYILFK